jgi:tetratricopeptide (TPR) repeat protein
METIGCLLSFSFATSSPDDTSISIPPLVHTWVQQRLEQDEKTLQQYREQVTYMLTSSFVFDDTKSSSEWSYERQILPHVMRCTEIVESQSNRGGKSMDDRSKEVVCSLAKAHERLLDPQKASSLYKLALRDVKKDECSIQDFKTMDAFGLNLALQGKYKEALSWYTRALEGAESTVGIENIIVLNIIQHIAIVFMEQGQYDQAAEQYQRVLLVQEKKYGKDHLKTIGTRYQLAVVYIHQENHDGALKLLYRVRDVRERSPSLGTSHPSTLETLESIAKVLEKQGKYYEALEVHHSVMNRKVSSLGENHHSTLETVDGIASMYARQEMWNEALEWNSKLLDGLSKLFGAGNVKHPRTFSTLTRIADVYLHLGRYDDAEKGYRKAYAGFKDLSMETKELETATKVGIVLRNRGHYTEALNWSRTAENGLEKKLGRDHTSTLAAVLNVASVLDLQGNYMEALKRYQQILTLYSKLSGPQHPDTLATTSAIANILTKQGAFQKALQLYTSTQPTQEKVLGPNHPQTLSTIQGHAVLLGELGKYDHSLQLHERVATAITNTLGTLHPETHFAIYHLALAHENKGQLTEASKCYNQVISGLPGQRPCVLLATRGMGNIHLLSQRHEQAHSLYQRAASGLKDKLGDKHPETLRAVMSQAFALIRLGRLEEAEAMYRNALGGCEETLGAEHPLTLTAVHGLALAWKKRKKFKEATAGLKRAKEGREKVLGKAHRDTEESKRALVKVKRRSWGWFF